MLIVHVVISGKVQGVWFRANTKSKADQIGIKGWVRNTRDDNVEALFQGNKKQMEDILSWCKQGPPHARVTDIKVEKIQSLNIFKEFTIRY